MWLLHGQADQEDLDADERDERGPEGDAKRQTEPREHRQHLQPRSRTAAAYPSTCRARAGTAASTTGDVARGLVVVSALQLKTERARHTHLAQRPAARVERANRAVGEPAGAFPEAP